MGGYTRLHTCLEEPAEGLVEESLLPDNDTDPSGNLLFYAGATQQAATCRSRVPGSALESHPLCMGRSRTGFSSLPPLGGAKGSLRAVQGNRQPGLSSRGWRPIEKGKTFSIPPVDGTPSHQTHLPPPSVGLRFSAAILRCPRAWLRKENTSPPQDDRYGVMVNSGRNSPARLRGDGRVASIGGGRDLSSPPMGRHPSNAVLFWRLPTGFPWSRLLRGHVGVG